MITNDGPREYKQRRDRSENMRKERDYEKLTESVVRFKNWSRSTAPNSMMMRGGLQSGILENELGRRHRYSY